MKLSSGYTLLLSLLLPWGILSGCGGSPPGPPPPLAAADLPAELQKAFVKAKPEAQEAARLVVTAVQAHDYPAAYRALQPLLTLPEATKQQRTITARSLITINQLLQEAQAKGDANAAAIIQYNRKYK